MITNTNLIEAFARNVSVIKMQTDGLTHEDSLLQPPFRGNCLNWVLGHITENRDHILEALGESPVIDEFGKRYARGSEPLTQAGDDVVRLEELLDWLERSQVRLAAALEKMGRAGVMTGAGPLTDALAEDLIALEKELHRVLAQAPAGGQETGLLEQPEV